VYVDQGGFIVRLNIRVWILAAGMGLGSFMSGRAQAPVVMHVTRSSLEFSRTNNLRVWGTIGAEKVELIAFFGFGIAQKEPGVLAPGDYPVKLAAEEKTDRGIVRKYDVEIMPGKHVTFTLAGLQE
jgi:hypothetical protein